MPSAAEPGGAAADGPEAPVDKDAGSPTSASTQENGGYALEIVCAEDTWLKVIADDAPASEHSLKPGDVLRLEAESRFNLLIGNAGGISVQLNGEPVPVPGGSGDVVNLELP
jgi:hypothetical protein